MGNDDPDLDGPAHGLRVQAGELTVEREADVLMEAQLERPQVQWRVQSHDQDHLALGGLHDRIDGAHSPESVAPCEHHGRGGGATPDVTVAHRHGSMRGVDGIDWSVVLEVDGSLRDIVVPGTDEDDWDPLLDLVARLQAAGEAVVRTEPTPLPVRAPAIFAMARERHVLLAITLGRIDLNAHFFAPEEIELDLDPGQFVAPADLDVLRGFMRRLGQALRRPVLLTPEGAHEVALATYDPSTGTWQGHPPG